MSKGARNRAVHANEIIWYLEYLDKNGDRITGHRVGPFEPGSAVMIDPPPGTHILEISDADRCVQRVTFTADPALDTMLHLP